MYHSLTGNKWEGASPIRENEMYRSINNLAEEARSGDIESLEELIKRMYPLLSSGIRKSFSDFQDREDMLQDGNLELILALKDFDPGKGVPILGYLKSRIRYFYMNAKKPPEALSLNAPYGEEEDEFISFLESDTDILEEIIEAESIIELRRAIKALPDMQNRVIVDLFFNDLSLGETAEVNGIAYRTVVNTRSAALKNLRRALGGRTIGKSIDQA
jgi:RNA polymerase sigma factor (sigma-70 family)